MDKSLYYISPKGTHTVQLTNKKYQNSLDFEHAGEIDNSKKYFLVKMSLGQKMGKGSIFVFFFIAIPLQHERSIEIRKKHNHIHVSVLPAILYQFHFLTKNKSFRQFIVGLESPMIRFHWHRIPNSKLQ